MPIAKKAEVKKPPSSDTAPPTRSEDPVVTAPSRTVGFTIPDAVPAECIVTIKMNPRTHEVSVEVENIRAFRMSNWKNAQRIAHKQLRRSMNQLAFNRDQAKMQATDDDKPRLVIPTSEVSAGEAVDAAAAAESQKSSATPSSRLHPEFVASSNGRSPATQGNVQQMEDDLLEKLKESRK